MRICIGTEPKTKIAEAVLKFSIQRRTNHPVEFFSLSNEDPHWQYPADLPVGTGFSLRRWLIPSKFDFQGRAIYLDADQIVLDDIFDLYSWDLKGYSCATTWQPDKNSRHPWPISSVMVIDCEKAKEQWGWHRDRMLQHLKTATAATYQEFMHCLWMNPPPAKLPTRWNHLDRNDPDTSLLHFTSEPNQPWYNPQHKFCWTWEKELVEAIKAGAVEKADFVEALSRWGVREDHRKRNGLHPYYERYLNKFEDQHG